MTNANERIGVDPNDAHLIAQIVMRAQREGIIGGEVTERVTLALEILRVHIGSCPLRLLELLGARSYDFCHDVGGIQKHLNRSTGEFTDLFSPRYSGGSRDHA